jgi:hypothetical protein
MLRGQTLTSRIPIYCQALTAQHENDVMHLADSEQGEIVRAPFVYVQAQTCSDVAKALKKCNEKDIAHRDLKPASINGLLQPHYVARLERDRDVG